MLNLFSSSKGKFQQKGQALPVGIAFIAFGTLLTIVLFNSGQLIQEKTKLSNTADAAVYSGLVWQARALNFKAYTNRAMVANQISIAQLVSINSWTEYGNIATRNANNTIGLFPPARPYTQGIHNAMTQINNIISNVVAVAIPIIDGLNRVLSETQRAMYLATFGVTPLVVREVVQANDPDYDVDSAFAIASLGENALDWNNFITRYDDIESLQRKASVINRSKDDFTRDRNWDFGRFYIAPVFRVEIVKEGETQLVYDEDSDEWAWKAKDTLSVHTETFGCSWRGCRWRHNEIPVAWGAAYSPNDVECQHQEIDPALLSAIRSFLGNISIQQLIDAGLVPECGRFFDRNREAERLANREAIDVGNFSGVQAYYDMADLSENNQDPRMQLRVEVQAEENTVRTSTKINGVGSSVAPDQAASENGLGRGIFWAGDHTASESIAAISTGEIYFERPVYRDEYQLRFEGHVQREYGNLFNPYWQVRLVETPEEIRLAAWAIREPSLVTGAVGGVVGGLSRYVSQQQEELSALQELQTYAQQEVSEIANYENLQGQLAGELSVYESEMQTLESEIASLQASGANSTVIAQRQQELTALENTYVTTQQQYVQVTESLTEAQMYEQQLANIESQIQSTEHSINNPQTSDPSEFSGSLAQGMALAGSLTSGGMQNLQQQLQAEGEAQLREAIEEEITEQIEEIIESAATSIMNSYAGSYGGYIQEAEQFYNEAEETVESIRVDYIAPLEEQIAQMRTGLSNMRQQMESEMSDVLAAIDSEINDQRDRMNNEISSIENAINQEISTLEEDLANAISTSEQQRIQDDIDDARNRLSQETRSVTERYDAQISELQQRRSQTISEFNQQVADAEASVLAEIARIEEQIEEIRARTSRG